MDTFINIFSLQLFQNQQIHVGHFVGLNASLAFKFLVCCNLHVLSTKIGDNGIIIFNDTVDGACSCLRRHF